MKPGEVDDRTAAFLQVTVVDAQTNEHGRIDRTRQTGQFKPTSRKDRGDDDEATYSVPATVGPACRKR